jgi:hypothetical protein
MEDSTSPIVRGLTFLSELSLSKIRASFSNASLSGAVDQVVNLSAEMLRVASEYNMLAAPEDGKCYSPLIDLSTRILHTASPAPKLGVRLGLKLCEGSPVIQGELAARRHSGRLPALRLLAFTDLVVRLCHTCIYMNT